MSILGRILLTRPGSPLHKDDAWERDCETCNKDMTNEFQISVMSCGHDHTLFCLECWRAINLRIEYFAENPEATLP